MEPEPNIPGWLIAVLAPVCWIVGSIILGAAYDTFRDPPATSPPPRRPKNGQTKP